MEPAVLLELKRVYMRDQTKGQNQIDSKTKLTAVEVTKTNTSVTIGSNSTGCSTPMSTEPEVKVVEVSRSVSTLDMPVIRGVQHAKKDAKVPCMLYVVTLLSNFLFSPSLG